MYLPNKIFVEPDVTVKPLAPWRLNLLTVADYIERNGWCQNRYNDGHKVCILGALEKISGNPIGFNGEVDHLSRFLNLCGNSVHEWNDRPERTKEEVLSALRNCAKEKEK